MLSFSGEIHRTTKYLSILKIITKSLQVPCSPLINISSAYLPGKRVLPFTSQKYLNASITVEAAFVLPLFVFLSLAILAPMQWLDTQRKVQTAVEQFAEKLSQYAYVMDRGIEEDIETEKELRTVFSNVAAGAWLMQQVNDYVDHVLIENSEVPDENGDVCFVLSYREEIPIFSNTIGDVSMHVAAKRRCWLGLDGKLKCMKANDKNTDESQEMVYVARNMGRYHRYIDCYHISSSFQAVMVQELETRRSLDGRIYYACEQCCGKESVKKEYTDTQNIVYITEWGNRYHSHTGCAALTNYVRKVPLAEVEYLGECSVCARRDDDGS